MKNNVGTTCRRQMWETLRRNGFIIEEKNIKISKREPCHLFVFCSSENTNQLLYSTEIFASIIQKDGFICAKFQYQYLCSLISKQEVLIDEVYNECWGEEELFSPEYQLLSMLYGLQLQYQNKSHDNTEGSDALCALLWKMCASDLYNTNAQLKYRKKVCSELIEMYNQNLFFIDRTVDGQVYHFSCCMFYLLYSLIKA